MKAVILWLLVLLAFFSDSECYNPGTGHRPGSGCLPLCNPGLSAGTACGPNCVCGWRVGSSGVRRLHCVPRPSPSG
uniref:Putative secreted protein n=1 Tax=Amblyomma triste TaxID=251400 RepID=A0A023G2Z6_AMBTT